MYGPGGGTDPPDVSAHGGVQSPVVATVVVLAEVVDGATAVEVVEVIDVVADATDVVGAAAFVPPHAATTRAAPTASRKLVFMGVRRCGLGHLPTSGTKR